MPETPSQNEDEYFLRQDAELVSQLKAKREAEREAAERKSHFMRCPKCGANLAEVEREHVAVDVCASCGGMWLDAGELEVLRKVKHHRFASFFHDILNALPGRK